jgi:hypothetical protein
MIQTFLLKNIIEEELLRRKELGLEEMDLIKNFNKQQENGTFNRQNFMSNFLKLINKSF